MRIFCTHQCAVEEVCQIESEGLGDGDSTVVVRLGLKRAPQMSPQHVLEGARGHLDGQSPSDAGITRVTRHVAEQAHVQAGAMHPHGQGGARHDLRVLAPALPEHLLAPLLCARLLSAVGSIGMGVSRGGGGRPRLSLRARGTQLRSKEQLLPTATVHGGEGLRARPGSQGRATHTTDSTTSVTLCAHASTCGIMPRRRVRGGARTQLRSELWHEGMEQVLVGSLNVCVVAHLLVSVGIEPWGR